MPCLAFAELGKARQGKAGAWSMSLGRLWQEGVKVLLCCVDVEGQARVSCLSYRRSFLHFPRSQEHQAWHSEEKTKHFQGETLGWVRKRDKGIFLDTESFASW